MSDIFDFEYKIIKPLSGLNHFSQFTDCLEQLKVLSRELDKQTVIVRSIWFFEENEKSGDADFFKQVSDSITSNKLNDIPYSLVNEKPAGNYFVELAIFIVSNFSGEHSIKILPGTNCVYSSIRQNDQQWIFAGGSGAKVREASINGSSNQAFKTLVDILNYEDLSCKNIVRQWNYIPDITGMALNDQGKMAQNYQEFNNVRAHWYLGDDLKKDFPAATGIGTTDGGVGIDFIALSPGKDLEIMSLHNPHQHDAHKYSPSKLIGDDKLMTPRFERGKMVFCKGKGHIWVSGTAAITGEESVIGNLLEQTAVTCDNIDQLISLENLIQSGLPAQSYLIEAKYIRGYVKNEADGLAVQEYLQVKYPDAIVHVLTADVCREELLVEIEGEFGLMTNDE